MVVVDDAVETADTAVDADNVENAHCAVDSDSANSNNANENDVKDARDDFDVENNVDDIEALDENCGLLEIDGQ